MTNPENPRNDTADEGGELANPGPVPAEPEDASDTGEGTSGDLAAEARTDRDD